MSQSRDDTAKRQSEVLEATKLAVQTATKEVKGADVWVMVHVGGRDHNDACGSRCCSMLTSVAAHTGHFSNYHTELADVNALYLDKGCDTVASGLPGSDRITAFFFSRFAFL